MTVTRFLVQSFAAGALAGIVAVAAMLITDVGGITGMLLRDPSGLIALALLTSSFVTTFGMAALCSFLLELGVTGSAGSD
jgi:hypothetical protein